VDVLGTVTLLGFVLQVASLPLQAWPASAI